MQERYGYRLLMGKGGVSGHIRGMGKEREILLRGLQPGLSCFLYCLCNGAAQKCAEVNVSSTGCLAARILDEGEVFAAVKDQVVAWEEEMGDPGYFAACRALEKLFAPSPAPEKEEAPAIPMKCAESEVEEEAEYTLRLPGNGEAVDALPIMIWPGKAISIRPYFNIYPPVMPFDTPNWRFVRAPSPLRGVGYCLVGCQRRGDRIEKIAYALPGHPQRPPALLPGYRYQLGHNGQGYWVHVEDAE